LRTGHLLVWTSTENESPRQRWLGLTNLQYLIRLQAKH
jgi:hypothetical protein